MIIMPAGTVPLPAVGMVVNSIRALDELLPRKEYESAVIIGRGLKGIIQAGSKEDWVVLPVMSEGRMMTLTDAANRALVNVVVHSAGEVPRWLEDDLAEIRDYLRKVGRLS